jgi:hypothetical protein
VLKKIKELICIRNHAQNLTRKRPTEVLDRILREGPNHSRVAVGMRET